jgi:hypothetical protein
MRLERERLASYWGFIKCDIKTMPETVNNEKEKPS